MRTTYGTNFALTNSGGLRSDLTCPTGGSDPNPNDFCPASLYPIPTASGLFPITRGQVLTVLPFGNQVATLTVSGAELKSMLENGASQMPAANGRFPQISGLCFTYEITAPAGSRVLSAVVANADGSCTATPVVNATMYTLATADFVAGGGDGYPNFGSRATTRDLMDQVLADYIVANTPISPAVRAFPNGRINCADANGATAPNCPALTASP
jgi:2',3'-cyclic-nucleotide 2'-phosphodiesterase (5'-nucleotidase family)